MATVADLVTLLDDKLLPYKNAVRSRVESSPDDDSKVRALNAGQHKVWALMLAAGRERRANWFAKSTTLTFAAGDRDMSLPTDCHDVLFVESTDGAILKPSAWNKEEWQKERATTGNTAPADIGTIYWIATGDYTPTLNISRYTTGLDVTVFYTSTLTDWTATTDNIDRILVPYQDAITNYAAATLISATIDPEAQQLWKSFWESDMAMIQGAVMQRQSSDMLGEDQDVQG